MAALKASGRARFVACSVLLLLCLFLDVGIARRRRSRRGRRQTVTLSCPSPGTTKEVLVNRQEQNVDFKLYPPAKDTLCTLTEVVKTEEDGTERIAAVARSYETRRGWQRVAGPYAHGSSAALNCPKNKLWCLLSLPKLSTATISSTQETKYLITSFQREISDDDWYARFLEMATFGPTTQAIDAMKELGHEDRLDAAAEWIQKQLVVVKDFESHRVMFRQHVWHRLDLARRIARPIHPCETYARWNAHSLFYTDRGRYLVVETLSDGNQLLSVTSCAPSDVKCNADNPTPEPRTIVSMLELFTTTSIYGRNTKFEVKDGAYFICHDRLVEEVGGEIWIRYIDPETQRDWNCKPLVGGNPKLFLPEEIVNDAKYRFEHVEHSGISPGFVNSPFRLRRFGDRRWFELPSLLSPEATPRSSGYLANNRLGDYMTNENTTRFCDSVPESGIKLGRILGTFKNEDGEKEMFFYDPRYILKRNDIDSPSHDGGGYDELAGSDCSNAPRTFLNEKDCRLSRSKFACSNFKANARIRLSDANIKELYHITGRFVYIIKGLRIDEERYHEQSPCLTQARSRWMKIADDDVCDTDAPESAVNAMRWYLTRRYPYHSGLIDVYTGSTVNCIADRTTMGMRVLIASTERNAGCWENVHPDLYNVYDVTYWSFPDTHPGNAVKASKGEPNPIATIAEDEGGVALSFPSWHNMDWWESNKHQFNYVGRWKDEIWYQNLPDTLRFKEVALKFGVANGTSAKNVLVCGSDGEADGDMFGSGEEGDWFFPCAGAGSAPDRPLQKQFVWTLRALRSPQQLRERVAWTLAQLLVVTPNQINEDCASEIYLNYYDIFVKHAFGNYRDVLKEVSFSPMMAEMLSFLNSKSTWYVWETDGVMVWPDENFSREMMQLFTLGTYLMNRDGSPDLDKDGNIISTYDTDNIVEFARAWTGFTNQERRGNIELDEWQVNRLDPLQIIPERRDLFPKRDLNGDYLGDTYPLCVDMPDQAFLRKGATYRLLGSSDIPEMRSYFPVWRVNQLIERDAIKYFTLDAETSSLYKLLCPRKYGGECDYRAYLKLPFNLECAGTECELDDLEVVKVDDVFYEYIRAPCVELSLYNEGKYIKRSAWPKHAMCSQPQLAVADAACCAAPSPEAGYRMCEFTGESMTFDQGEKRCTRDWFEENELLQASPCDWRYLHYSGNEDPRCATGHGSAWYWTDTSCELKVKIKHGDIAVVHEVDGLGTSKGANAYTGAPIVSNSTFNYFKVNWLGGNYPDVDENSCADGACDVFEDQESGDRTCMCSFETTESRVFSRMPGKQAALKKLKIGSFPPEMFGAEHYGWTPDETGRGVSVWHKKGGSKYDGDTIFKVTNEYGRTLYLKNVQSMAKLLGSDERFWFRNPPRFMSLSMPTIRDAMYETDALLDHYFYHRNVGPFLARRFIQRFGVSNPSPLFVKRAATAFFRGSYRYKRRTFGSGSYGDLGAMVASILLDPEMTTPVLDMDPTHGSVREPMIKLVHLMRAMEFDPRQQLIVLRNLQDSIGQAPYGMPDVFSFFRPEYQPTGGVRDASLAAPETQVLTTPNIVGILNGMFSLIEIGLSNCFGGFGRPTVAHEYYCRYHLPDNMPDASLVPQSYGTLQWNSGSSGATETIDKLATLLTAGRLSAESRELIKEKFKSAGHFDLDSLKVAQKLIVTTPEFHTTSVVTNNGEARAEQQDPEPSRKEYRAVVYVYLHGGIDSHNVLIPHSNCAGKDHYDEYRRVRGTVALQYHELLPINASGSEQVCEIFGVNPDIPILKELYDDEDLVFFANAGILSDPDVTKENWQDKVGARTALFAHNIQQLEVERVDLFDGGFGKGLLGRMTDVLEKNGHVTSKVSTFGVAEALVGDSATVVANVDGVTEFHPIPEPFPSSDQSAPSIEEGAKRLNDLAEVTSGVYGETWSSLLFQALGETRRFKELFETTQVTEEFPNTHIGKQLAVAARLIKTRVKRGVDRDAYYIWHSGYDTHGNQAPLLTVKLQEVNEALSAFVKEIKTQGIWENVTIVFASEFARTITANSGDGTDHAWGGNYWMAGGSVKGGKIHGKQLDDITEDGPMTIGRGRILIPTLSWDSILYGVMQWMGIKGAMKEVLPNYKKFQGHWLTAQQLFRGDTPECHPRGGACEYDNDCCDGDQCSKGGLCVAAN